MGDEMAIMLEQGQYSFVDIQKIDRIIELMLNINKNISTLDDGTDPAIPKNRSTPPETFE